MIFMGRLKDPHIYNQDGTYRTYEEARKRKDKLKSEGFRVKIRKSEEGHVVYKKNIVLIDMQRNKRYQKGERR
jgi:hypothetical protein